MTDNQLRKKEWANLNLNRNEPHVKKDICSKCGRKRPVGLMAEIGYQVYVCKQCLMN